MYFELVVKKGRSVVSNLRCYFLCPMWVGVGFAGVAVIFIMFLMVPRIIPRSKVFDTLSSALISVGLPIKQVVVYGNHMVSRKEIMRAVEGDKAIVLMSLEKLRKLIKLQSPWIKEVAVSRVVYSGTLNIGIREYTAFANWRHDGVNSIIDSSGYVILNSAERFDHLISIYGGNAAKHLEFVREVLEEEDILGTMISSFAWFDEGQRWNVNFSSGLLVKLPKRDPRSAWKNLTQMYEDSGDLLMWKEIDMSILEKVTIKK